MATGSTPNQGIVSTTDIDPKGKYVLTTHVSTDRIVRGFKLPPTIGFEARCKLEGLCMQALLNMEGDVKGDYFPLRSSNGKKFGMLEEKVDELMNIYNLFQEPASTLSLASCVARDWPTAQGVFHNVAKTLFVCFGEGGDFQIVSTQGIRDGPSQEGKDIRAVTDMFISACDTVQKVLKAEGYDFVLERGIQGHLVGQFVLIRCIGVGSGGRRGTYLVYTGRDPPKTKICKNMPPVTPHPDAILYLVTAGIKQRHRT
jgi:hypothetical protein